MRKLTAPLMERFWDVVWPEPMSGCWLWAGNVDDQQYGRTPHNGRSRRAHRISYETHKGPIPPGLVIDHLCRNPSCVNPDHLEAVTNYVNVMRGRNHVVAYKQRTHCSHGHEYSPENTYFTADRARRCRKCELIGKHRRAGKGQQHASR